MTETDHGDRNIRIPGVWNLRDVGGLYAQDGTAVARGRVFRAEALAAPKSGETYAIFSEESVPQIAELGLRTVVDLRTAVECAAVPSMWPTVSDANYHLVPIEEGAPGTDSDLMAMLLDGRLERLSPESLGQVYVDALSRRSSAFVTAMRIIAGSDSGPVLIHCAGGKDRTGLVSALILRLVDVSDEDILRDYEQTGVNRPDRVLHYEDRLAAVGLTVDDARALFETPRVSMEIALEYLDSIGGAETYLLDSGMLPEEIARLRMAMLDTSLDT